MRLRREEIRRAKEQVEVSLTTDVKDNKNVSINTISNKKKAQENLLPLLHDK